MDISPSSKFELDFGSGFSLLLAFGLMPAAQIAANLSLPKSIDSTYYWLFLWCAYDSLTHFILEGSYLFHCFFSYETVNITSDYPHPASLTGPHFLGHADRRYGSKYSKAPMARLWQEYAKADRRWGGADTTVISLELLTVLIGGPMAAYLCILISRIANSKDNGYRARTEVKLWFTAIVLSTGELYGGFVTFAPEWLSGSTALATNDPILLWVYLFFFNTIWVFIPAWVLWKGYAHIKAAFTHGSNTQESKKRA